MVGICQRKMLGLAGSGVGAVPPSGICRRLCQPSSRRLGASRAHTGLSRPLELMFTPHRLLASLTSPTSAVIIRELEQMAAELAEKRKISYTAATCCEQVLPSSASQEDDSSCDPRGSCRGRGAAATTTTPETPAGHWGVLGGQPRSPRARGVNHSVGTDKAPPREPRAPSSSLPEGLPQLLQVHAPQHQLLPASQQDLWKPALEYNTAPVFCLHGKHLHAALCCFSPRAKTKLAGTGTAGEDLAPSFPASKHTRISSKGYDGQREIPGVRPGGKALQDNLHPRENPGHPRDSTQRRAGTAQVLLQALQGGGTGCLPPLGKGFQGAAQNLL